MIESKTKSPLLAKAEKRAARQPRSAAVIMAQRPGHGGFGQAGRGKKATRMFHAHASRPSRPRHRTEKGQARPSTSLPAWPAAVADLRCAPGMTTISVDNFVKNPA
ncbi:MAG: hypothetical protein Q4D74_03725 [Comamonadaceae bacterium]|nr:hypothetical protein [Comamonadaceae bacterium]